MVFAVNCPPQEPADGQATCSIAFNSLSSIVPRECFPTASKTSTIVKSLPLYFPGSIEPPYMNTEGIFKRTIAIINPGNDLSHPANPTIPS